MNLLTPMRAFIAYWVLIAVTAVAWLLAASTVRAEGVAVVLRDPVWLVALLVPPTLAGIDLVAFRRGHETVCRVEAQRHAWLRLLVGNGYSARTFALTGVAMLAGVLALVIVSLAST